MNESQVILDMISHGVDRDVAMGAAGIIAHGPAEKAWAHVSQQVLTPAHDFALHLLLYDACYGENALLRSPGPAWFPSNDVIERANVTAAVRELGLADFPALHRWSVEHRADFWALAIRRLGVVFREPPTEILDAREPKHARWLVDAKLNIVQSCLQGDPAAAAILESDGAGPITTTTYGQLRKLVARVANALTASGVGPADAVAMVAPLSAATVATYLAVIAAGAAVVSIADSFAPDEIATRLRIAKAKLVVTQDFVPWGAKRLPLYEKLKQATTLPIVVITTDPGVALRTGDRAWADFLSKNDRLEPVIRDSHDVVNILFSSGTTGEPKAIPWDHTTPIKCAMDGHFHHDLHPGDVTCWPTNLGWMMGPWLIFASLMNRCAMALYQQAPHERGFGQFVQDARVTMLGGVPSLVRAWRSSGCMKSPTPLDWSRLRAFSSSGECSNAADQFYLMHLAGYRPVIEYCGGTEIGGGYVTSTVVQPNTPSTFTTAALGIDIALLGERPGSTIGEAFLVGPSIGLSTRLLNRDHDAVYFADTPPGPNGTPLRRHGDELESLPTGSYRVAGRSDDTMNLGGIKVGCAEIERVLNVLPGVQETAAVAVAPPGGGPSRLIVFTVAAPGTSEADLKVAMQNAIRAQLNPLFRLDDVRLLPSLPRTASNKVMRRELRAQIEKSLV